ncbi:hypothetical protein OPV22_019490 [Ensete ventricosum]|uniref:SBP-type domain-containing protein n=1 Tax=Ensete ventricosum TaxID=4639 RepID=A0AAV8QHY0_ENSVE|nr:hypothetical protein OPV22_019490 [Ensete ventricosum]
MEWNAKLSSWVFSEVEQVADKNMEFLLGSSFVLGSQNSTGMDCSVDLKLGASGDIGPAEKSRCQPSMSTTTTTAGPSRRARAPGNAGQNASCSVDRCKADLSGSREYHRRHKVCEVHSKTPVVMVGGQEQRFCQQCSRFHRLVEFDEAKRSCRKRLDGHNRRRRKPPPDSINPGSLLPNHQGSRFLMQPHLLPSPTQSHNWAGIIESEDMLPTNHSPLTFVDSEHHLSGSFSSNDDRKQVPLLQGDITGFSITTRLPFLMTVSSSTAESSSGNICALSLLSSATKPGTSAGHMLPADGVPMHQSLVSSLACNSSPQASTYVLPTGVSCPGVEDEQLGSVIVRGADASLHCQSVFHAGGEGSSDWGSQAPPFSWQ